MKKLQIILIAIVALFASSCNENRIFNEYDGDFADYRWSKSKVINFSPTITDTSQVHKICISLRHVYGMQLKTIKVNVDITSPSNKTETKNYDLNFYDDDNQTLSGCAGDYCDLDVDVEKDFKFDEKGTYKIAIRHLMETDPIPNIIQVWLIIDQVRSK